MKIGVTSQNFRTITGHAGKSRRFLIFSPNAQGEPVETERLDLPKEMSLHAYHGNDHPLFGLDALICGGSGEGFVRRLAGHGVRVINTGATDPLSAVRALLKGEPLPPAAPHEHDHDHDHQHDHRHEHSHGLASAPSLQVKLGP
jgi:predicted Fe-Mo cluster-binding NifX family protein